MEITGWHRGPHKSIKESLGLKIVLDQKSISAIHYLDVQIQVANTGYEITVYRKLTYVTSAKMVE